ncbi:MAG: response regulator [Deltaproteobacteria bacterium]|nr:response regulator [Deltaproteobacteria bacterium]
MRVLIIDPETGIAEGISKTNTSPALTVDVIHAPSGQEGLKKLKEWTFDIVVIARELPDMDGLEVLEQVVCTQPRVDTAVVARQPTVEEAVDAMRRGATHYVARPEGPERLAEVQREFFRARHAKRTLQSEMYGFTRWSRAIRAQHLVLMITFILLTLTGIPLLFPETFHDVFFFSGSSTIRSLLHRFAAVALMALSVWHVGHVIFTEDGRLNFRAVLPGLPADLKEVWGTIAYDLGLRDTRPVAGKYNVFEKFEYFAVVWGTVVMVASGLVIWFTDEILAVAPLWVIEVAQVVHYYEAILAVLSVAVWHLYNVHFRPGVFPMSRVWLDGKISLDEMLHEHAGEFHDITGREAERPWDPGNGGER